MGPHLFRRSCWLVGLLVGLVVGVVVMLRLEVGGRLRWGTLVGDCVGGCAGADRALQWRFAYVLVRKDEHQ